MKKTRRFKSKGWYGVGEDEGFDPMFDVEIVREMDVGPIVYWDYGFIMKSCNQERLGLLRGLFLCLELPTSS